MILNIIGLIIGIMILCGGSYYLIKESHDRESRKIYGIAVLIGAVIVIGSIIRIILSI